MKPSLPRPGLLRGRVTHSRAVRAVRAVSLGLLAALAGGCAEDGAEMGAGGGFEFRVPVTWALTEPGDVAQTVELVGDVISRRWSELAFERAGRVVAVLADLADVVAEGQVLARLDDAVLRQELAVARAAVLAARADADFARREAERAEATGDDILSASERDRRVSAADVTAAQRSQREADVARLEARLRQGELRAPFAGTVVARAVTDGTYAAAGRVAFTLVDMEHREVRLEVPAPVATALQSGVPVTLRLDERPGFSLQARLDELVPAADLNTRTFTGVVRLDGLDDARHLLPGLFVRARLERARVHSETVVPADAVLISEAGAYVVLVRAPGSDAAPGSGTPAAPVGERVPVRVLARNAGRAAVVPEQAGALLAGAVVAVTGADNVYPGAPLSPVPPLPGPDPGGSD